MAVDPRALPLLEMADGVIDMGKQIDAQAAEITAVKARESALITENLALSNEVTRLRKAMGPRFAGDPGLGRAYFGGSVGLNADPVSRETLYGAKLSLTRTYWRSDQVDAAVARCNTDLAQKRLPWISFKLPVSWSLAATGGADAWAQGLATKLASLPGPVWVAIHHEPEKDGPIEEWKAIQRRLAPLFSAANICYSVILTGWNQLYGPEPEYKLDAIWPGGSDIKMIGMDPYNWFQTANSSGVVDTKWYELESDYFVTLENFAKSKGIVWAIAETGYTDAAATRDALWLPRTFDRAIWHGAVGVAYFDTDDTTRPTWNWAIDTTAKQTAFKNTLLQYNVARLT